MPEGNRGGKHKTGLIIGGSIAVAIIVIFGLIAVGFLNQAGYSQYAADKERQFAQYARNQERQSCQGLAALQLNQCLAKARIETGAEKRGYEHDEDDLIAQRKAALWAEMMGLAALLGMGLSIVGVVLVYVTFRATREGNAIQKRIGEAQTRAYLSVIGCTGLIDEHGVPHFGFTIKNSGQSPALKMRLTINADFSCVPPDGGELQVHEMSIKLSGIFSVAATDVLEIDRRALGALPAEFMNFKHSQTLVSLTCEWEDVFESTHGDKRTFAIIVKEWPDGVFALSTSHEHVANLENEKLRRMAAGEWKGEDKS